MASDEDRKGASAGYAIVGYAARFPGAADAEEFWQVLRDGRDAVSEVPGDRWDADEFFDAEPGAPGKVVTRRAGFVDDVIGFDAPFFGISTREARLLDPQHRLLLETAWRAVEHSGTAPTSLANSNTGVFVGLATHDYLGMASAELAYPEIEAYMAIGTSNAAAAGRISYRLGLQGPSVAVDTACSSSLVAIHQACQALRLGECDLALAGGANVLLTPATMVTFSHAHMLAPDGRCKTFDAAADGYVRGEGCGVIVLKRLEDAVADGDRIRAVIRGSAINQDGASGGLTVPNGVAQQRVIAEALQRAGIAPADVGYLEAHGTGTSLGDPIEAQAAGLVLGEGREPSRPLLIGSAKTNIGHLEAAAGIAGVIKVILALEHELLPQHLHFRTPSPHIPWDRLAIRVVGQPTSWERNGRPRIAGVSSFGFAGTNAHVVIEEAPAAPPQRAAAPSPDQAQVAPRFRMLALSARTPTALVTVAQDYRNWLSAHPQTALADLCLTAGVGRAHFEHRAALVVDSTESAAELLAALADDRPAPGLIRGISGEVPKTAWLFTGQGSQYPGMARELFETEPVFAETLNRCADVLSDVLEIPLLEVIFDVDGRHGEETLRQTCYAQPALFAVEMGLARLWQSWGFEPDVVAGHSVGQYSAACVAGIVSLEDGARLMAERGRLFASLPAGGRMVAVFAAAERVEALTDEYPALSVAAYNGANTVLSGPARDLEQAVATLTAGGVRCDWLETSHAFHSALLDPILDEFESYADTFDYRSPQRILVCNRTGSALGRSVKLDGNYWRRHARQPVEFAKSVQTLADLGCKVLLEIGPQPVLTAAALRAWPDSATAPRAIASLRRNTADQRQITEALADAYAAGHLPDFGAVGPAGARKVDLPGYPFEHREYWFRDRRETPGRQQHPFSSTEAIRLLEDGRFQELATLLGDAGDDQHTVKVLTKLAAQHNQQREAQSIADARYEMHWQKSATPIPATGQPTASSWLVISGGAAAAEPVVAALTAGGHRHQVLGLPGSDADEEELAAVLRAAAAEQPELRILHIAGLDSVVPASAPALARIQHRVLGGTRRLVRAAAAAELRRPIWVVTRGAQRVADADAVSPEQGCLWGFWRAASLEHPQLWGGLADLDSTEPAQFSKLIDQIVQSADANRREDHIALRDGTVYVPRLIRRAGTPNATPLILRADATYLVTGGLGSIGLEVGAYLAAHGARQLVLTSRRVPGEAAQQRIDALREQYGCAVRVLAADISDAHDVAKLLATVQAELPPLAGIVHAAGEIATSPLGALDYESQQAELDRVFAGKVWGAWHLGEAAADLALDFFVCTSSIASVWGGFGQTAYSAANAFLDGLAWRLRQQGVAGFSVNFGPWSVGMADEESRARLGKRGIRTLTPADALAGMADLIAAAPGPAQGVVARVDWATFLPLYQQAGQRPLLAELEREVPSQLAGVAPTASGKTELVERLAAAPVQQRRKLLLDHLRGAVAEVTQVDPAEVREDAGFFDLGMDSLMAVELRQRIERGVGTQIPATLAMDYPRLSDVVDYLLGDVLGLSEAPATSRSQPASAASTAADEPIAIVAVSCRFPGAPDPEAFWDVLSGGVDAIREVPDDRFDIDEFYDPDPETPGKIYSRFGGFLDGIDEFDPEFFGISPREAVWIEPQQRLMLETVWEGFERAGYAPSALRGSRTGVFVGVAANEYAHLLSAEPVDKIEPYFITGNALNAISGRVAFALGLEGPAVAVDTACSSSLVAVHQACLALRSGDCDLAVAGGVNVLLSPVTVIAASRARMLSPVGRCKTFDASADGYVRSEGCGVLVLKRLSDAVRDGDRVAAVIPSSAINQDGASSGLTVPNGGAQQRLIGTALARAGLIGADVDYLEAHGTGTPLGDPIEVQAAGAVYGAGRAPDRPLLMGSVKTNIGHLESASGAAGLIKVVLSLQHQMLPASLHFDKPSPHIPWDSLPVQVVDKPTPWQANGRPRRAGVSSFGFTGTNAHVLIEEAPSLPASSGHQDEPAPESPAELVHLLPLSARSPEALMATVQRYRSWLTARPDADISEVCRTAGTGRSHFEHRAALVVNSVRGAVDSLADLAENRLRPGVVRGECTDRPTTAWLFTGQGSQHPGMARELFGAEPIFADTVMQCADAVEPMLPRGLLDVMFSTDRDTAELMQHTSFAQPALFAVEMGLARLWQSWGVEPDVVLGHSVGQYAAACVAGVFSLEDGARLIAERGRLFGSLPEGGRMVAVFADANRVEDVAKEFLQVSIAAYNGPNVVLSGPAQDLEQIVAAFGNDGVRCGWLHTSHAFHSELLEPVLGEFEGYARQLTFAVPSLPLVCNRTGTVLTADTMLDAAYWRRHSRQPVQFAESVRTVAGLGCSVLMEIGPQPVLTGNAVQIWPDHLAAPRAIVSLRKGVGDRRQIAEALGAAYVGGHRPKFDALHRRPSRRLELPTYPFQRRRFWPRSSGVTVDGPVVSGILGSAKDLASGDSVYTSRLSVKSQPWLADHVIYGTVVVPGATYAAMALAAVGLPSRVQEVFFYEPIILPEKSSREVQLTLHPSEDGSENGESWSFQVHSRPYGVRDADWVLNADGVVASGIEGGPAVEAEADTEPTDPVDMAIERLERMRPQELFETFADMELAWGPCWSGCLKSLWLGEGEAIGDITVGAELADHLGAEPMHPVLLDLCTGVAFPAFPALLAAEQGVHDLFLPLRYGQVVLAEKMPRRFYCRARWHASALDSETQVFDLDFVDRDNRFLGGIREFTVKRAPREALLRGLGGDTTRLLYSLGWHEVPAPPPAAESGQAGGTWLVAGFDKLAAQLAGCVSWDRRTNPEPLGQLVLQSHQRGMPFAGIVWRVTDPAVDESSAEAAARLQSEIGDMLGAVHALQGESGVKLPGGLWIITERAVATESGEPVDPVQAALWGLGRTVVNEEPALHCKLVDHDGSAQAVAALAGLLATPMAESEIALRQGKYLAPRLLQWSRSGHLAVPRGTDYALAPTERGAIDNLRLTEVEVAPPDAGYVQVRVEAAGLNFRDVLNVLGLYPGDPGPVGGDFAGVVTALGEGVTGLEVGQRVYGSMQGAFASRFAVPAQFVAPIPDGVSAVQAATIPAAALTVRLSFDWAKLNPGDKVLIHAASGGVGLAAIQMAQQHGAEVYATASTFKRETLRKLGVKYVYDSRTTDFAEQILADTDGAGVDVVLNSLTNEGFIEATLRATAQGGRFAEIAKRDIWTPEQMAEARPDIAYEIVALDTVMFTEPDRIRTLLGEVSDGLAQGEWTPLPAEIYPLTEARTAFRRMQQARHIGKIVLQMPEPLQPRADRSYLITGGLGAIGLHLASYLAQLGAGDIVLTSRRAPDAEAQRVIEEITDRYKCRVHAVAADVGDEAEVARLLQRIRTDFPPLAGVAHLAGVLDDALLSEQSWERFQTAMAPKAFGAWHLDRLTRDDALDFFIVSSSVSSLLGAPGQANYSTANAFLDGLVAQRRACGLPATGINFGPWGQGGMASSEAARANIGAQGLIPLEPSAALGALAAVVASGCAQATVLKANWQRAAKVLGGSRPPMLDLVLPSAAGGNAGDVELLRKLQEIPVAQRADFITEFLQREVQGFLRLAQPPAATSRFLDLGTDSLMAVELRNRLHSQFGGAFTINATAVFDYPTIGGLGEYLAAQLPDAESPAGEAASPSATQETGKEQEAAGHGEQGSDLAATT